MLESLQRVCAAGAGDTPAESVEKQWIKLSNKKMFSFHPGLYFQLLIQAKRFLFSDLQSGALWRLLRRCSLRWVTKSECFHCLPSDSLVSKKSKKTTVSNCGALVFFLKDTNSPLPKCPLSFSSVTHFESSHWKNKGVGIEMRPSAHKGVLYRFVAETKKRRPN